MTTTKRFVTTVAGILLTASIVCAQDPNITSSSSSRSAITITAATAADRVRFTAPSSVVQMRLEVYAETGEKVFDNEIRGGNVIDWRLQDGQAQRLSDGSYLCVVTGKSLSGRTSQKLGSVTLANSTARLEPADTARLTSRQSQAVGPLEEDASLKLLDEGETQTGTAMAHDGTDGQIIRGRGALSFRMGDLFSGNDREQMRLTPEGNLGIGIIHPAVRLDVDGLIRASQGIVFPDGTIQYSAASRTLGPRSSTADQSLPGAENPIDSLAPTSKGGHKDKGVVHPLTDGVYDVNASGGSYNINAARVGIGTANPVSMLDVAGNINTSTQYNIGGNRVLSTTGIQNVFVGVSAGVNNTGQSNSFFGSQAGLNNTSGNDNSFVGTRAGTNNLTGYENSFFGYEAGFSNTSGLQNSFFGLWAGKVNVSGVANAFFGYSAGNFNNGHGNSFFGDQSGFGNTTGGYNSFVGYGAGSSNTTGSNNASIGIQSNVLSGNLVNATAIGAYAAVNQSNSLVLGSINGVNSATADTNVGIGTTTPTDRLTVKTATSNYGFVHTNGTITVGSYVGGSTGGGWYGTKSNHPLSFFVNNGAPSMTITTSGFVAITSLSTGGATALCRNALNVISTCSSSLRYKTAVQPFSGGLDIVSRLRPISFTWKEGGMRDLGFGAEDVAQIDPLLVTYNDNGQVEGVKYDRISVALVNAAKEQQGQIRDQQEQIRTQLERLNRQQEELGALRKLVCSSHPRAKGCKK